MFKVIYNVKLKMLKWNEYIAGHKQMTHFIDKDEFW